MYASEAVKKKDITAKCLIAPQILNKFSFILRCQLLTCTTTVYYLSFSDKIAVCCRYNNNIYDEVFFNKTLHISLKQECVQSLAYSPPGIAMSPLAGNSERQPCCPLGNVDELTNPSADQRLVYTV